MATTKKTTETAEQTTAAEKAYKVKVKITYKDKETGEIHKAGEALTVTATRYKELTAKRKYVERI